MKVSLRIVEKPKTETARDKGAKLVAWIVKKNQRQKQQRIKLQSL